MNMEKKKGQDVLGDVVDIKSWRQLPGSWMPNDWGVRAICIFQSGDEMHFQVLNREHSTMSAAPTDSALYRTRDVPEQLIRPECV